MIMGERIRAARKNKKLTQKQLAQLLNVATGTIQQYELGKRTPRFEQAQALADVLGVSLPYFWGETGFETIEKATEGYAGAQKEHLAFKLFMEMLSVMYGKCEELGTRAEHEGNYLRTEMFYLYENSGTPFALLEGDASVAFNVVYDTIQSLVNNLSTTEELAKAVTDKNAEELRRIMAERASEKSKT